jgi:hypothetical protein
MRNKLGRHASAARFILAQLHFETDRKSLRHPDNMRVHIIAIIAL